MKPLDEFLTKSPVAGRVTMRTRLILEQKSMNRKEIGEIAVRGEYGPMDNPGEGCKLECGGQVVATGKLVKKSGKFLLKIIETEKE